MHHSHPFFSPTISSCVPLFHPNFVTSSLVIIVVCVCVKLLVKITESLYCCSSECAFRDEHLRLDDSGCLSLGKLIFLSRQPLIACSTSSRGRGVFNFPQPCWHVKWCRPSCRTCLGNTPQWGRKLSVQILSLPQTAQCCAICLHCFLKGQ